MKSFAQEKIDKIIQSFQKALPLIENPVAAFDADGTLWSHDAGEQFFKYQIENKLLPNLPSDPWAHYDKLKVESSPQAAFLWLAQVNRGQSLETVREWSMQCMEDHQPVPLFEAQKQIISFLQESGVEIFVVTASIKWAVEPGAALYNIPQDHVVGISTQIENGVVTDIQDGPITYREGKVDGLLHNSGNRMPFFASGNTPGDEFLLKAATHFRLVMASALESHDSEMFQTEQSMIKMAKEQDWFFHSYA